MTLLEHPASDTLQHQVEWSASDLRRVVIRLRDGEVVPVGTAPNRDSAMALARTVIKEIEAPSGEWPLVGDRLLRPDAIVSIDVIRIA